MSRMRNSWILPVSIVIALVLGLLPPAVVQPLRPYWLALVLAYWVIEEPDRVGLGAAFVAGVLADLLYGGLLGEQALRLVIMTFILQRFRARMRFFPISQQALAIGGLLLNDRIVSSAVHLAVGEPEWHAHTVECFPIVLLGEISDWRRWRKWPAPRPAITAIRKPPISNCSIRVTARTAQTVPYP